MTSVALAWSSAFDSDLETCRRGQSNRKPEYEPQAYYNGTRPALIYRSYLTLRTETGELVYGPDSYPLRDLQFDFSRERDPLQKRINRWLRQIARSEGHDVPFEEDDIQPQYFTGPVWQEWGKNDWVCAVEALGPLGPFEPDPLAVDEASDPKLKADFIFVEKTARKRKMTEKDARRLHIVFRVQVYFVLCRVAYSHRAYFIGTNRRKAQENQ